MLPRNSEALKFKALTLEINFVHVKEVPSQKTLSYKTLHMFLKSVHVDSLP